MSKVKVAVPARYRVVKALGQGGMGQVVLGHDTDLDRPVAIKLLARQLMENPVVRARFAREAKVQSMVDHPHVIKLYDFDLGAEPPYLVMEFVEGGDLEELIEARGSLPVARVQTLAREIGEALDTLHAEGIVHRDLKPANIMVRRDGRAVVMDLGLAGLADATLLTRTGQALGTPRYFPPEMARGKLPGPPADQFQLGAILFEVLTGKRLIRGDSLEEVLACLTSGRWTPFPEDLDLPEHVRAGILRACSLDPDARFECCADLARAIRGEATEELLPAPDTITGEEPAADPATADRSMAADPIRGELSAVDVPAGPKPLWKVLPVLIVLGFLYGLLAGGAAAPVGVRFESLGETLLVRFESGPEELVLHVAGDRAERGTFHEELEPTREDRGGRFVFAGLHPERTTEAWLTWPGGEGERRRFRADGYLVEGLPRPSPEEGRTLRLRLRRAAPAGWAGRDQELQPRPAGERSLDAPAATGEHLVLRWQEERLDLEQRWSWEDLHRGWLEQVESLHRGPEQRAWMEVWDARGEVGQGGLDEGDEAWEALLPWVPEVLQGPLPRDDRSRLFRLLEEQQLRRTILGQERYACALPCEAAGHRSWEPLDPALFPHEAKPRLVSENGQGYVGRDGTSIKVAIRARNVFQAWESGAASFAVVFEWPADVPREGGVVALGLDVRALAPEVRFRFTSVGGQNPFSLDLWPRTARPAFEPRSAYRITACLPASLTPAPGTRIRIELKPVFAPVTSFAVVEELSIRWRFFDEG